MEPPAEISAISLSALGILLQETAGQTSRRAQPASRSPSERSAHGSFGTDFASEKAPKPPTGWLAALTATEIGSGKRANQDGENMQNDPNTDWQLFWYERNLFHTALASETRLSRPARILAVNMLKHVSKVTFDRDGVLLVWDAPLLHGSPLVKELVNLRVIKDMKVGWGFRTSYLDQKMKESTPRKKPSRSCVTRRRSSIPIPQDRVFAETIRRLLSDE